MLDDDTLGSLNSWRISLYLAQIGDWSGALRFAVLGKPGSRRREFLALFGDAYHYRLFSLYLKLRDRFEPTPIFEGLWDSSNDNPPFGMKMTVGTDREKHQLLLASKFLHDDRMGSEHDSNVVGFIQHIYLCPCVIVVENPYTQVTQDYPDRRVIVVPELPGCTVVCEHKTDANTEIYEAIDKWIVEAITAGIAIPVPLGPRYHAYG